MVYLLFHRVSANFWCWKHCVITCQIYQTYPGFRFGLSNLRTATFGLVWFGRFDRFAKTFGLLGTLHTPPFNPDPTAHPPPVHTHQDALDAFMNPPGFYDEDTATTDRDEYEEYIRMAPVPCEKPLEWWGARREEYPRLSRLAFDLLSIPLMSAECERVFSAAKRFVTDERNKLREDILEAMIVLRAQYKAEESEAKEARR